MSNLEFEKLVKENEQLRKENKELSLQNELYSQFFREAIEKMQDLLDKPIEAFAQGNTVAKTEGKRSASEDNSSAETDESSRYDDIIKSILDTSGIRLDLEEKIKKQKQAEKNSDKQEAKNQETKINENQPTEEVSLDEIMDSADKVCNISDSLIGEDDGLSFDAFVEEAASAMPRVQVYNEDEVDESEEERKRSLISILKDNSSLNNNM